MLLYIYIHTSLLLSCLLCPITSVFTASNSVFLPHVGTLRTEVYLMVKENLSFLAFFYLSPFSHNCFCDNMSLHAHTKVPCYVFYIKDIIQSSRVPFCSNSVNHLKYSIHCPFGLSKTSALLCPETSKKQMSCPLEMSHHDSLCCVRALRLERLFLWVNSIATKRTSYCCLVFWENLFLKGMNAVLYKY